MNDASKKCCPDEKKQTAAGALEVGAVARVAAVQVPHAFDDYCVIEDFGSPLDKMIQVKLKGTTLRLVGFNNPPKTHIAVAANNHGPIPLTPTTVACDGIGIAKEVVDATPGNYEWGADADDSYIYMPNPCPGTALSYTVILWHVYQTDFSTHILIETAKFNPGCPAGGFRECS